MENKAKHTPGPWAAEPYAPNSLGYKNGKAFYIKSDDGTPAFQVIKSQTFDHRNGKTGHFYDPSAKAKDAANARLIAAAPELLAALESVLEDIEAGRLVDGTGDPATTNAAKGIRAAVAKAKGE